MSTETETATVVGAHLVGGIKAPDTRSAMTTAAQILGRHLYAIPDGETGIRATWIAYQMGQLTAIDGIDFNGTRKMPFPMDGKYIEGPAIAVDASLTELPPRALGYANCAEESYKIFKQLRDEDIVPAGVKFEVAVPTPYAIVTSFIREEDQERFLPIYQRAMEAELDEIAAVVDHDDLLVQIDVAIEFAALTGGSSASGNLTDKDFVINSVQECVAYLPSDIERGPHLCYGDFQHQHFAVPQDLSLCVEIANACADDADFVHMPADRNEGLRPGYYEALRELKIDRLSLGVIDYAGDRKRTEDLISAAIEGSGGRRFSIATECGLARIDDRKGDGPSLEELLQAHADMASPIR